MSGVEVAGLALAFLPLLISAAEHYDKCLRPFIRYKNLPKEADHFQILFGNQKRIFKNQCQLLLEKFIEHDVASSMLDGRSGVDHPSWSDVELEEQLTRLLGESMSECITTIKLIKDRLGDIDTESQELGTAIDQDPRITSNPIGSKSWKRRIAKLNFGFSKPRLDQTLSDLRSLNEDFRVLCKQTLDLTSLQSRRQAYSPVKPYQEVERYQIIRQASRQVYEALGRACTKHTEHQAHFCVEVEQANITDDRNAQIKFSMAYTQMTLAGSTDQSDLIWFAVDSTNVDAMEPNSSDIANGHDDTLNASGKRQIEPASGALRRKTLKRVRFQSASLAPAYTSPTSSTATLASNLLSSDSTRKDFCDVIRTRLREPLQTSDCVGILESKDRCKSFVYPSPNKRCRQMRQAISLGQVISSVSERKIVGGLALYDRLRLARTLATAVLQYHSTPWLRCSWRSEDVYFFGNPLASSQDMPSISSPHLNVKVKEGPCEQLPRASTISPHKLARNPLLFSLGVVLLEIAHTSTIDNLQKPDDLDNGQENGYTEFFAARRLAESAQTDMGPTYHKVVEKVVECDFGCGMDLNDPQLQAAFHHDVICPLEKLEQKLREIHFDTP